MVKKLTPTLAFDTLYQITPELLHRLHIKALLIDLDGTMASCHAPLPPDGLKEFLMQYGKEGIKVAVFSNNNEKRVSIFCQKLDIPFLAKVHKPFSAGYARAERFLGVPLSQTAVVGDQIYTDVFGGNRFCAASFYVRSWDEKDFINRLRFLVERPFVKKGFRRAKKGQRGGGEA